MSTDCLTHAARSPGPKSAVACTTASTGTYSCGPFTSGGRFALSRAFCAVSFASSTIAFSESSSNSRVDAVPCFWPCRTVSVSCWSYCTRLTVIEEFAQRVADRSPPSNDTSTASAFVMLSTLSVSALISSREYIGFSKFSTEDGDGSDHRRRRKSRQLARETLADKRSRAAAHVSPPADRI